MKHQTSKKKYRNHFKEYKIIYFERSQLKLTIKTANYLPNDRDWRSNPVEVAHY